MKYQVTSDNMEVSPSMLELAKQKLAKIEHKLADVESDLKSARVVLNTAPQNTFDAKIELTLAGKTYYASEVDTSLETALVNTVEGLDKQLQKAKSEHQKNWEKQREMKRASEEGTDL